MRATLKAVITDIPKSHEVDVTFYVQKGPMNYLGPLLHPYSDQVFSVRYLNKAKAYQMTSTGDCDVILHAMFPEGFVITKWELKDYPPINHCSVEESLSAIPLEGHPMCVVIAHYRSQSHSFPVAIFSNDTDAISCANQYTEYRGNRVYCTVDKIDINFFNVDAEIKTEIYSTL